MACLRHAQRAKYRVAISAAKTPPSLVRRLGWRCEDLVDRVPNEGCRITVGTPRPNVRRPLRIVIDCLEAGSRGSFLPPKWREAGSNASGRMRTYQYPHVSRHRFLGKFAPEGRPTPALAARKSMRRGKSVTFDCERGHPSARVRPANHAAKGIFRVSELVRSFAADSPLRSPLTCFSSNSAISGTSSRSTAHRQTSRIRPLLRTVIGLPRFASTCRQPL